MMLETNLAIKIPPLSTVFDQMVAPCLPSGKRNAGARKATMGSLALPRLGIALVLLSLFAPSTSEAQQSVTSVQKQIAIQYGRVAQHYRTSWSDPTLPAGVTRGAPPPINISPDGLTASGNNASGTFQMQEPDDSSEFTGPAILYAVDMGDDGMKMILSAKTTMLLGNCIAVESSGNYTNLRSVNLGYCDPANQETVSRLKLADEAAARRCMMARQSQQTNSPEARRTLTPAELAMLCDGS